MFQVLLDKIRKSVIIDQVGIGRNLFDIHRCSGDQRSALRNVAHPLIELLHLGYLRCADRIEDLGFRRDHVRSDSAGVCDRAVNSRRIDHVLSHIVDTDIHDLNCVQRRTPKLRSTCRMGGNSMESKECTEVCQMITALHCFIHGIRMPCDRDITVIKVAVANQICFSACILLCRAAIVTDRSAHMVLFHIRF